MGAGRDESDMGRLSGAIACVVGACLIAMVSLVVWSVARMSKNHDHTARLLLLLRRRAARLLLLPLLLPLELLRLKKKPDDDDDDDDADGKAGREGDFDDDGARKGSGREQSVECESGLRRPREPRGDF